MGDGILYATHITDTFLLSAQQEPHEPNAQALYIAGVVVIGFGATPREILHKANGDLGSQMAKVRNAYAYVRGKGGLNLPTPGISRAQQVFSAVTLYIENLGDDLRALLSSMSPIVGEDMTVRALTRPGAKRLSSRKALDQEAKHMSNEGRSIKEIIRQLADRPEYKRIISRWTDPEETIKKRIQRFQGDI